MGIIGLARRSSAPPTSSSLPKLSRRRVRNDTAVSAHECVSIAYLWLLTLLVLTVSTDSIIFLTADTIALTIQGVGGGLASSSPNPDLGGNIMLGGIVIQLGAYPSAVLFSTFHDLSLCI